MTSTLSRPATRTRSVRARLGSLAEALTTPLVPSDYLDLVAPLRSGGRLRGRVEQVLPETRDAVTLVIRPGRGWHAHQPGQYVRIGVDVDGVRQWRAYSLTSGPRADGCIAVTVKAIPDGVVSNHLVRRARPGLVVQLDQATGDFTMPSPAPAKVLFVTAGSGITPVMGMLRNHRLDDVVVLHSAPTRDDVIFAGDLRTLAAAGRITLIELHTDDVGMLDPARLAELVPDLHERAAWACGPIGLLDLVERHYGALGLTELLHVERFRPSVLTPGEGGTITIGATEIEADGGTTILAAAESAGVLMPSGCRMGICYGCVLPLREGAVRDLRTGDLTEAAPGVLVQTCISGAAGDCTIGG